MATADGFFSGGGGATFTITNNGTALTWNLLKRKSVKSGTCEIWYALVTSIKTGLTVTATNSGGVGDRIDLQVITLSGHNTTNPFGAVNTAALTAAAITKAVTTTVDGGQVFAAFSNSASSPDNVTTVVGSNQTKISQGTSSANHGEGSFWRQTNTTTSGGTPVTNNLTTPATKDGDLIVFEVVPPGNPFVVPPFLRSYQEYITPLYRPFRPDNYPKISGPFAGATTAKSTTAILTILESKVFSTVAVLTTLESAATYKTVSILTTLETAAIKSTAAILTTLESNFKYSTVAILTSLEKTKNSTIAVLATLESHATYSTVGVLTTLETTPQFSTTAVLTNFEVKKTPTIAILTSLEAFKYSNTAVLTTLESSVVRTTTAIITTLEVPTKFSTVAILTQLNNSTTTVAILYPSGDTFVNNTAPNTNYDGDVTNELLIDNGFYLATLTRILVKFSLTSLPLGAIIQSAKLKFYTFANNATPFTLEAHKNTADFTASTATWNNKPAFNASVTDSQSINALNTWFSFDVTGDIGSSEITAGKVGWTLKKTNEVDANLAVKFHQSEYTTDLNLRPYLELVYVNVNFSTSAILTTLEIAPKKSTVAISTTFETPTIKSVSALYTIFETIAKTNVAAAILTILEAISTADRVDQVQQIGGTNVLFGQFANTRYRGQGFQPGVDGWLTGISFQLNSVDVQGIKVYIDSANSDSTPVNPVGSELYSFTIPNGSLSTSLTKYTLPTPLRLSKDTQYVFYLAPWDTVGNAYADDLRGIDATLTNPYSRGASVINVNGNWSQSDSGVLDFHFITYEQVQMTTPILTILETIPVKNTAAILTTLESFNRYSTIAIKAFLEATILSNTAILAILETSAVKNTVAVLTTLESNNKLSTVAISTNLESNQKYSTTAVYTLLEAFIYQTVALLTTLEIAGIKSTTGLLTTFETIGIFKTVAIRTTLELVNNSTFAILTTLETAATYSTVAISTSLEAFKSSTVAIRTTLETIPFYSTTSILATFEAHGTFSTVALLATLETANKVSTVAVNTTLEKFAQNSTTAILTNLESNPKYSTNAILATLEAHATYSTVSVLTTLENVRFSTTAILTTLETSVRYSTSGILTTLENTLNSTVGILTTLEIPKFSTTAIITILEAKLTFGTVGLVANFGAVPGNGNIALIVTLEVIKKPTIAILTSLEKLVYTNIAINTRLEAKGTFTTVAITANLLHFIGYRNEDFMHTIVGKVLQGINAPSWKKINEGLSAPTGGFILGDN